MDFKHPLETGPDHGFFLRLHETGPRTWNLNIFVKQDPEHGI